jgi:hypothetical protein
MGLLCSYFLFTLLIFIFITNTGILGMMRLKTLSFAKVRNLPRVDLKILTGS